MTFALVVVGDLSEVIHIPSGLVGGSFQAPLFLFYYTLKNTTKDVNQKEVR